MVRDGRINAQRDLCYEVVRDGRINAKVPEWVVFTPHVHRTGCSATSAYATGGWRPPPSPSTPRAPPRPTTVAPPVSGMCHVHALTPLLNLRFLSDDAVLAVPSPPPLPPHTHTHCSGAKVFWITTPSTNQKPRRAIQEHAHGRPLPKPMPLNTTVILINKHLHLCILLCQPARVLRQAVRLKTRAPALRARPLFYHFRLNWSCKLSDWKA